LTKVLLGANLREPEDNMINPTQLEEAYKNFTDNFNKLVPDGVIPVNLPLLSEIGLLNHTEIDNNSGDTLTQSFNVIEANDKVTLYNHQFAIWIVPQMVEHHPLTLTFISLLIQDKPHLEIVFSTSGVYNTPKYILKVLQHFLKEVIDTEAIISAIGKKN